MKKEAESTTSGEGPFGKMERNHGILIKIFPWIIDYSNRGISGLLLRSRRQVTIIRKAYHLHIHVNTHTPLYVIW